jgi:cold shock CspA family protein
MAKSKETYNKKEKEKKRLKKRQDKQQKMEERRQNAGSGGFDSMIAYVDEFGNITDTPANPMLKKQVDAETIIIGVPKRVDEPLDSLHLGVVDFFNENKGYGFIKDSSSQERYFVHANGLIEKIKDGDRVSFELEKGPKGLNATKVKKA